MLYKMYESSFPFQALTPEFMTYVHQLKDAERPVYFSLVRHTLKTNAL